MPRLGPVLGPRLGLIPQRLLVSHVTPRLRYELWFSPERKPLYRIERYEGAARVTSMGALTEIAARKMFERLVEQASV
jgi:hypothetical protein